MKYIYFLDFRSINFLSLMEIEKNSDVRSIRRKLKLPHFLVQNNQFENLNFEKYENRLFYCFPYTYIFFMY